MPDSAVSTPYDLEEGLACEDIAGFDGPLLVDLDETLYMRNSTEDFIDSARPAILGLFLMRLLDVIKPWRWAGGDQTRDIWRVRSIRLFFPWTMLRWRYRVAGLASQHMNSRLATALRRRNEPPIVLTVGFQPVVQPLVAAMGLGDVRIVAARLNTFADRQRGKLAIAIEGLGGELVERAAVVTDSTDDLPLLKVCARPMRVLWSGAQYRRALSGVYLPGQYLSQVKRPGERYIVRGILQEDFAFWLLSSIALAAHPFLHFAGLLMLLVSFWSIYETGYVDNDAVAAKFESAPKLSAEYWKSSVATPVWQPWFWAVAAGAVAIVALSWPMRMAPAKLLIWTGVLLVTYLWFRLYNRFDKATRVWMFVVLQFARSAAFLALVPVATIGAVALAAHVLARWVPYLMYRTGNKGWPDLQFYLIRMVFFLVLAAILAIAEGISSVANLTTFGLFAWNGYRARREIAQLFASAHRIDSRGGDRPATGVTVQAPPSADQPDASPAQRSSR